MMSGVWRRTPKMGLLALGLCLAPHQLVAQPFSIGVAAVPGAHASAGAPVTPVQAAPRTSAVTPPPPSNTPATSNTVPEPGSLSLLLVGVVGLIIGRRIHGPRRV